MSERLSISTSPFLHAPSTTPRIMWEVVFSLIPVFGAAFYYFGFSAVLVSLAAIAGCLITEWWLDPRHGEALKDGSALISPVDGVSGRHGSYRAGKNYLGRIGAEHL